MVLAVVLLHAPAPAEELRAQRVHFAPGSTGVVIAGSIEGQESVDYLLGARAGQTLEVSMDSDNSSAYFNVIPPDAENVAVYSGTTGPGLNHYQGELDLDGEWKIRVYLYRAAARRGETADYRLDIDITGEPDSSVAREANDFGPREWDARGDLVCARRGQPQQTTSCPFKVTRYEMENGATVFVVPPGTDAEPGSERILYFLEDEWSTPTHGEVSVTDRQDTWTVTVGDELYEIPEAVIFGD
jgi:hypothetical protein